MISTKKTGSGTAFSGVLLFSFLLLLATPSATLWGQTTAKYVPSNAFFVLTTHLQNLDKKVDFAALQQLDVYHEMVKKYRSTGSNENEEAYFEDMLRTPSQLGFDVLEPSNFFACKEGIGTFLTFVGKMGNRLTYENRLQQLKGEDYLLNLQQKDGYNLWTNGKEAYAWNDEVIVNIWYVKLPGATDSFITNDDGGYEAPPEYEWEEIDTVYEEDTGEVQPEYGWEEADTVYQEDTEVVQPEYGWEEADTVYEEDTGEVQPEESDPALDGEQEWQQTIAVEEWAAKIMTRSFLQPISANAAFQAAAPLSFDFHAWMDYGTLMDYFNPQQSMGMAAMNSEQQKIMAMMQGFMEIFYADTYLSMGLNFENGKMAVQSEMFFNEEMKPFYKGVYDVKFNRKFLRYVKGDDKLFGYYYMNFNLKNAIHEGKDLVYKLLDATPAYGNLASDALKILGIFIDEDAIANLLKGDLLLAVPGMQTTLVNTKIYDMDEEFNTVEKDTVMLKTIPIVTALLSYGSEKDMMKFVNLGVHSKVLKPQGRYYTMTIPNAGIEMYLALHNGILLLTNDRELVQNRLDSGYPRSQRLSKKHRKTLCDNASAIYWDIPNTLHEVASGEGAAASGIEPYVNMVTQEFESISITASRKVGSSIKGTMNFNFANKDSNSLQVLFHFLNDLFLDMQGGAKM
ncbi:MAG: DUF4836 family protein [Saprospiraceae bacterium]|nr:MAG: DUF4836 family protein [Saprospiraceae bacterium]